MVDVDRKAYPNQGVSVYSLLHCHFESALRALALVKPDRLRRVQAIFSSWSYKQATPAERLSLLSRTVLRLTNGEDIFRQGTFRRITRSLLDEMRRSRIEHVDLRVGPTAGRWRWMRSAADGLTVFREELARYEELSIAFLAGVNMTKSQAQLDTIFDVLSGGGEVTKHIAGIDINFLPDDLPKFDRYLNTIRSLQRSGLKINMHLGELFDNEVSQYVLSRITPDRIGHGILLLHEPALVELVSSQGICLDMCPTSNTRLGVVDWRRDNPVRRALRLGVPVSLNTDDPVLFDTTIDQEFRMAGLTNEEHDAVVAYGRKYRYDSF